MVVLLSLGGVASRWSRGVHALVAHGSAAAGLLLLGLARNGWWPAGSVLGGGLVQMSGAAQRPGSTLSGSAGGLVGGRAPGVLDAQPRCWRLLAPLFGWLASRQLTARPLPARGARPPRKRARQSPASSCGPGACGLTARRLAAPSGPSMRPPTLVSPRSPPRAVVAPVPPALPASAARAAAPASETSVRPRAAAPRRALAPPARPPPSRRALDHRRELAHVARPRLGAEQLDVLARRHERRASRPGRRSASRGPDVLRSRRGGRWEALIRYQRSRRNCPGERHRGQVAVGRGDDADVDVASGGARRRPARTCRPGARAAAAPAPRAAARRSRRGTACRRRRARTSPGASRTAPVKLPRSCPNSSESTSSGGIAPQFTRRNGPRARARALVDRARDHLLAGAGLAE